MEGKLCCTHILTSMLLGQATEHQRQMEAMVFNPNENGYDKWRRCLWSVICIHVYERRLTHLSTQFGPGHSRARWAVTISYHLSTQFGPGHSRARWSCYIQDVLCHFAYGFWFCGISLTMPVKWGGDKIIVFTGRLQCVEKNGQSAIFLPNLKVLA